MKIIVLAGGSDQIALINELKNRGHYIILIDYFKNPIAKDYADKHITESTLDINTVTEVAKSENVDLILTACTDQALLTMASVSETLNLPCYISLESAKAVTNKRYMKQIFNSYDIPTSKHIITSDSNTKIPLDFIYPLVIKPVDCNSSKGVKLCYSYDDIHECIGESLNLSNTGFAIIEEYKKGIEISADFFIVNGKVIFLCATQSNKIKDVNSFTITQSFYPALDSKQEEAVTIIGQKIASAFNLANCPMFLQLIITPDNKIFVIEFSARMGGGSKYKLIEVLTSVNIMKAFVDLVLGEPIKINVKNQVKFASINYVYGKNGIFCGMKGFEKLIHFQYSPLGTSITKAETSSDRLAGFLLTADTEKELSEKIKKVNLKIKALDINGDDIIRHDLIEECL